VVLTARPDSEVAMLRTEFAFTLPLGYLDETGMVHKEGTMRLATAADEILPLRDPRVAANQAYLVVLLLSRVVTRLGTLRQVDTNVIEGLFSADLAYLQDLYRRINETGQARIPVTCPACSHTFEVDASSPGESLATPSTGSTRR
jgi:hypothetical protein